MFIVNRQPTGSRPQTASADVVFPSALSSSFRLPAAYCATQHPDFSRLAARISVSNLHKNTTKSFSKAIELFHSYIHPKTGRRTI